MTIDRDLRIAKSDCLTNFINSFFHVQTESECVWEQQNLLGDVLKDLKLILGPFGCLWGTSWSVFGESLGRVGRLLASLGRLLGGSLGSEIDFG